MARMIRTLLVPVAAAGVIAGAGGCHFSFNADSSHSVSKNDVAAQIKAKMTDVNGNKPDSVKCPGNLPAKVGAELTCEMKINEVKYNVKVTVTSVEGKDVKFDMVKQMAKDS
ncbi:DUF4333 domain-containing protein [Mycobacterium asiaticum]|uniref:DUF4333 domain-containing protein n=1 Tax=Mycobacterium asiaticum TaxID=1790 RepID=A0A1A3IQC3_MYCAS|nr:DUF4333 domain-containing protein [Mycobacterium asiaticum]OBI99423.1 hypothetical protein A5661_01370 [Mycobacterium asiaticum]OBJ62842.1 hypothetical protein A9W94_11525 [Mycobacterium asiaticum]OBJ84932.1 hypothetical protein A5640_14900 [Mycobacterium asiaticum]ORA10318.1 hypothetical protein BST16_22450 [Mycobacterium asiaticum DSM 44297]